MNEAERKIFAERIDKLNQIISNAIYYYWLLGNYDLYKINYFELASLWYLSGFLVYLVVIIQLLRKSRQNSQWLECWSRQHIRTSRRYQCNINSINVHVYIMKYIYEWINGLHFLSLCTLILMNDEGVSFITFVWRSLYPKGDNVSKDEGL